MSRSSLGVSEIISLFPGVIRYFVSDAKHNHYTLIDSSGAKYYLIITSRVLRFPQSIGINYSGMMVGINRRALYEVVRDGDYALIVWGIKDDKKREITVFSAKVKEVTNYVKMFGRRSETTCRRVKGSDEVVCHYPLQQCMLVGVVKEKKLSDFFKQPSEP